MKEKLKFRIWDKKNKCFLINRRDDIGCCDIQNLNVEKIKNILNIEIDWENGSFILNNSDYIFLQYTGIKDINGTEIYVGDIVLWKEFDNFGNTVIKYSEVFFDDGAFRIASSYFEITNYIDLEVIGNIYLKTIEEIKDERKEK